MSLANSITKRNKLIGSGFNVLDTSDEYLIKLKRELKRVALGSDDYVILFWELENVIKAKEHNVDTSPVNLDFYHLNEELSNINSNIDYYWTSYLRMSSYFRELGEINGQTLSEFEDEYRERERKLSIKQEQLIKELNELRSVLIDEKWAYKVL